MCMKEECKTKNSMTLLHNRCRFADKQVVRVQEKPDEIPEGGTPHTVSLLMHDKLVDAGKPRDRVEIGASNQTNKMLQASSHTLHSFIHSSEMLERKMVGFYAIVAVLGIISAATGFAGEATRIKASDVYLKDGLCVYPSSPALAFGFIAAVFAIITRIYISLTFGGSNCCRRDDPNSTLISKCLYVLSWIASVSAVVLLLAAATLNDKEGGEVDSYGYSTCYVVKPGIFAAGAVLALLSTVFGIAAYVTLSSATKTTTNPDIALSMADTNEDLEKSPLSCTPQQHSPHQQQ